MRRMGFALLGLGLLGPLSVQAAEGPLKLDAEAQARLGVRVAPLAAASRSATTAGFARVLDAGPLAALDSDLSQTLAAASASQAETARARALNAADSTISTKALQAAEAQSRADQAKVTLLRRRLGLEWGPAFARMSDTSRARLIADLASGQAALVRIDTPSGLAQAGLRSAAIDLGPLGTIRAEILGPARTAEARLQSSGLIGLVRGPAAAALAPGLTAPVTISAGDGARGVLIPRSALVRAQGQSFVYLKSGDSFVRKPVAGGTPQAGGLFAGSGFTPGQPIAVEGAAALLTAETAPPPEAE